MLIFSVSYKEPAHAAAVVAPVIDTAIEIALAALGITIAGSVPDTTYKQIINNIKTQAVIDSFGFVTAGQGIYNLGSQFLKSVGDSFMSWYNGLGVGYSGLQDLTFPLSRSGFSVMSSSLNQVIPFSKGFHWSNQSRPIYSWGSYIVSYTFLSAVPRFGSDGVSTLDYPIGHTYFKLDGSVRDTATTFRVSNNPNMSPYTVYSFYSQSLTQLGYVVALKFESGVVAYYLISNTQYDSTESSPNTFFLAVDSSGVLPSSPSSADLEMKLKMIADGISILNNSVDVVISRLNKIVGVLNPDGSVSIPANIPKGAENDTSKARDTDQEKVVGQTVATDADRASDDATNADRDTTLPKPAIPDLTLPEVIFKEKFPFCLPWDLYTAFSNLQAPPQPPKWEVPFKIQSINYEQDISIDFSQFSTLASILRWGLSVLFIIFLILLTRQIIGQ